MTNPLVSYIVPAHNAANFLVDALKSCRDQDYRPIEVIVIDDGSVDNTSHIVKEFIDPNNSDGFTVVYERQTHKGVSAARNLGLDVCRGELIGFLDADDVFPSYRTSVLVKCLKANRADIVYGKMACLEQRCILADEEARRSVCERVKLPPFLKFAPLVISFLMTREFAEKVGKFDEELWIIEDWEYAIRLRLQKPSMYKLPKVVYWQRAYPGSVTRRPLTGNKVANRLLAEAKILELAKEYGVDEKQGRYSSRHRLRKIFFDAIRCRMASEAANALQMIGEQSSYWPRGFVFVVSRLVTNSMCISCLSKVVAIRDRAYGREVGH